jgi:isoquinoline 1-oxidoreductase alpha subunit
VIVDGSAALSCTLPIGTLEGADVTTVEGLVGHPLIQALVAEDAIGCGFCLPGFTCAVAALLQQNARPAAEQIDALPNRCACGLQPRLRRVIDRVVATSAPPVPAPATPPADPEIVSPPR